MHDMSVLTSQVFYNSSCKQTNKRLVIVIVEISECLQKKVKPNKNDCKKRFKDCYYVCCYVTTTTTTAILQIQSLGRCINVAVAVAVMIVIL